MNRIPVELEEDILSRIANYHGVFKMSLLNKNSRRQLIEIGRNLARVYAYDVGVRVALTQNESFKDNQILLWKLIVNRRNEEDSRNKALKYCVVQYPKPRSLGKIRRLVLKIVELAMINDYSEEIAQKIGVDIARFLARNGPMSITEKLYAVREVVQAYYKFIDLEENGFQLKQLLRFLAAILPESMIEKITV
jgi:hypothetical protein